MWKIANEDEHWERVREELEIKNRPGRYLEEGKLYLDDEAEKLESEYGCSLQELYEADLAEIVFKYKGISPEYAEYNKQFDCIVFEYYAEAS